MVDYEDTACRIEWDQLPGAVRAGIAGRLGSAVVRVEGQRGGFSHGMAARLWLNDGSRAFVKAIRGEDELARMYRREADAAGRLPEVAPAARCRFGVEVAGWFVAGFEDVEGTRPRLAEPGELADVLRTVGQLAELLTPSPLPDVPTIEAELATAFAGWRGFAESGAPADLDEWSARNLDRLAELETGWSVSAPGETLLHADLSPGNMVRRANGEVVIVDWAWACRGAAWIDLVLLAPYFEECGVDPEAIIAGHPVTEDVEPAAIDSFVCGLAGYWAVNSRRPPPPGSPHLRAHQARFARLARDWLRRRVRWA
ncbi:phosphotransferase [Nocardia colli]|uniref:Phosphotransferase n=1 Tax=Nocardia colli TaxID=2545717 RepID=A0A5N0E8J1_9NOCA|nr:phosphotransferase [Nocardia colli]KAA8885263.1 phosphotransferase [Nocardia colli]